MKKKKLVHDFRMIIGGALMAAAIMFIFFVLYFQPGWLEFGLKIVGISLLAISVAVGTFVLGIRFGRNLQKKKDNRENGKRVTRLMNDHHDTVSILQKHLYSIIEDKRRLTNENTLLRRQVEDLTENNRTLFRHLTQMGLPVDTNTPTPSNNVGE